MVFGLVRARLAPGAPLAQRLLVLLERGLASLERALAPVQLLHRGALPGHPRRAEAAPLGLQPPQPHALARQPLARLRPRSEALLAQRLG